MPRLKDKSNVDQQRQQRGLRVKGYSLDSPSTGIRVRLEHRERCSAERRSGNERKHHEPLCRIEGKRSRERQFPERASDRGGRYLWFGTGAFSVTAIQPLYVQFAGRRQRVSAVVNSNSNQKANLNVGYKASSNLGTANRKCGTFAHAEGAAVGSLGTGRSGTPPGRRMSARTTIARATITTPTSTPTRTSTPTWVSMLAGPAPPD